MWLAPFEMNIPGKQRDNVVYIVLDRPVSISALKLWNYSKVCVYVAISSLSSLTAHTCVRVDTQTRSARADAVCRRFAGVAWRARPSS